MEENKTEISFSALWRIFKRCWVIMAIALVAATVIAGVAFVKTHRSEYTAHVTVWMFRNRTPSDDADGDGDRTEGDIVYENLIIDFYNAQVSEELLPDCMEILLSNAVLSRTADSYAAAFPDAQKPTVKELKKMVKVSLVKDTRLLELSVTTRDKETSMNLANIWSKEFQTYANDVLMNGQSYIQIADPAILPAQESNPISLIKIALVGILAAVLVYAVVLIRYLTDDKISSPEDVKQYLGLNILGAIPTQQNMASIKWQVYAADPKVDSEHLS